MGEREQWFFYASRAAANLGQDQVNEILRVSQGRNQEQGLTGVLLFTGSHFAQVLEGDPARLEPVVRSILADPRHHGIRVLGREPLARRRYRQWSLRLVTHLGRADLIEDLIESPDVPVARALRLIGELFRSSPAGS